MAQRVAYDWPVITAEELRAARIRAGYRTQADLAEALGVHKRTVTNWERRGSKVPRREEDKVRKLLAPTATTARLDFFGDWDLYMELGQRIQRLRHERDDLQDRLDNIEDRYPSVIRALDTSNDDGTTLGDPDTDDDPPAGGRIRGRGPRRQGGD